MSRLRRTLASVQVSSAPTCEPLYTLFVRASSVPFASAAYQPLKQPSMVWRGYRGHPGLPVSGRYFRSLLYARVCSLASALARIVRQPGAHTRSLSLSPPPPREAPARALPIRVRTRRLLRPFAFIQSSQSVSHQHTSTDQLIPTTTADCASPTPPPSYPSSPHPSLLLHLLLLLLPPTSSATSSCFWSFYYYCWYWCRCRGRCLCRCW